MFLDRRCWLRDPKRDRTFDNLPPDYAIKYPEQISSSSYLGPCMKLGGVQFRAVAFWYTSAPKVGKIIAPKP